MEAKKCRAGVPSPNAADFQIAGRDGEIHSTTQAAQQLTARQKPPIHQGDLRHLHPTIVKRLVPMPNWVVWKFQPNAKGTGWTKVPYQPLHPTRKAATTRKRTWGSYADAVAAVEVGKADGIGFVLFETNICAFDLDNCRDAITGKIDPVATALMRRCGVTYIEETVGGRGLRCIGLGGTKETHRKQTIIGSNVSVESYRFCPRFITISNQVLDSVKPNMRDLGDIDAVITAVVDELDHQGGISRADNVGFGDDAITDNRAVTFTEASLPPRLLTLIREGVPDTEDRSRAFHHAVKWLKDRGWTIGDIVTLLARYPNGIAFKYGKRLARETDRAFNKPDKESPGSNSGDNIKLDDFYAYMPSHAYIFTPTREMWPARSVNSRLPLVALKKPDGSPVTTANGKPKFAEPSAWLDNHRPVEQMTWAPGEPLAIEDRLISEGGWIKRKGVTTFNVYRPPTIKPGDVSKAGPWADLVRKVYPGDADHIFDFFAHRRQRPEEKINHSVLLGGDPGIGKDSIIEPLKQAVGPWNCKEVSPQDMMSTYNNFMQAVVLRISEARDLGDINRFSFYDHLKTVAATPPDVVRINEKYIPQHYIVNVCGVIITTNYKSNGIYLPADDRRTYVAWSQLKQADFEPGYWPNLWDWYQNQDGFAHVAAFLDARDISGFDPKAPPEKTAAFWAIVDAGIAPEQSELADVIDEIKTGGLNGQPKNVDAITLKIVIGYAEGQFQDWLLDRKNRRAIPHRFEKCGYVPVRNPDADDGLWVINRRRQVIYARASLPIAEQHEAARGLVEDGVT